MPEKESGVVPGLTMSPFTDVLRIAKWQLPAISIVWVSSCLLWFSLAVTFSQSCDRPSCAQWVQHRSRWTSYRSESCKNCYIGFVGLHSHSLGNLRSPLLEKKVALSYGTWTEPTEWPLTIEPTVLGQNTTTQTNHSILHKDLQARHAAAVAAALTAAAAAAAVTALPNAWKWYC